MENPPYPDDNSDCPEIQQKSPKPMNATHDEQHRTSLHDSSKTNITSKVEQRRSIHSVNAIYPDIGHTENSQYGQNSGLYPSLQEGVYGSGLSDDATSAEEAVSHERPNLQRMAIAIFVVVISILLGIFLYNSSAFYDLSPERQISTREEETGKEPLEHLKERFHSLRSLFSGQTGRLWTVCLAAIRPLLDIPKHPAVILLAGSKQMTATTDCIALKMSAAVKDAFEAEAPVAVFDCRKYKDWEPQEVKREMDKQLTEAFENGAKVGVVLAVESLPGTSPMIFYRFCDTANAPFKDVVLILTLNMKKEPTSDRDSDAHEELGRLWNSVLDAEQVDPLFSRIGNSVAYVSEEADLSHCQRNY